MVLETGAAIAGPSFLITAFEAFHISDEATYHEWIISGPDRVFGTRAARRGVRAIDVGPPGQLSPTAAHAVARIDAGVWLADCPNPTCNSAMTLVRGAVGFMCGDCFNADVPGRRYRALDWPEAQTMVEVERIMLDGRRGELGFMHWRPGTTVEELDAQGEFHHSWTTPKTYSVGAVGTAAERNTYERDNLNETAAAKAAGAGDVFYGTAANALAVLAASGNGGKVLKMNVGETAPEWGVGSMITADAFEWWSKVAQRYVLTIRGDALLAGATYGDLIDVGWAQASATIGVATGARTGDLDAADDFTNLDYLEVGAAATRYFVSPHVIGGRAMLESVGALVGERPTTITCWFLMNHTDTTDAADGAGFGIRGGVVTAAWGTSDYAIMLGGTNFELWDGAAATDLGVAKDTDLHLFEFVIDIAAATMDVKLDGSVVLADEPLDADEWPKAMGIFHGGTGSPIRLNAWGVNYD